MPHKIGIIGGSGLDNPQLFTHARDVSVGTPWGDPSCALREGEMCLDIGIERLAGFYDE